MQKEKLMIGMMLEDIESDFSKELVKSVVNSLPSDKDLRLVILPGKYYDDSTGEVESAYRSVHNCVFRLAESLKLDGMIIHLGSMSRNITELFRSFLMKEFSGVPKVFIGLDDPGLVTVNYDNRSGISEAVEYLINVCGLTRFCMLGGREDNKDARFRKNAYIQILHENGIPFDERSFVNTDMTEFCVREARKLLDANPGTEAVFCVNDASAKALYKVMEERDLVPGRDMKVFGFDNTYMSTELIPPLASIGAFDSTLGQKAVELLLDMINGAEVTSAEIGTKLYGRDSLPYDVFAYTFNDIIKAEDHFIYKIFDDCFYRYRTAYHSSEMLDLRRLYYEIISRMLFAFRNRYMSVETYEQLIRLIDIFFDNEAVLYTDASKLLLSIKRLQDALNDRQRSAAVSVNINRLFLHMKDKALCSFSNYNSYQKKIRVDELGGLRDFMIETMGCGREPGSTIDRAISSVGRFGIGNAALFLFDQPLCYDQDSFTGFPKTISMRCVVRNGVTRLLQQQHRSCLLEEMPVRRELSRKIRSEILFPVFHRKNIYGFLMCGTEEDIFDKGEYMALQLGRSLFIGGNERV